MDLTPGGLASGIDTATVIEQLMELERSRARGCKESERQATRAARCSPTSRALRTCRPRPRTCAPSRSGPTRRPSRRATPRSSPPSVSGLGRPAATDQGRRPRARRAAQLHLRRRRRRTPSRRRRLDPAAAGARSSTSSTTSTPSPPPTSTRPRWTASSCSRAGRRPPRWPATSCRGLRRRRAGGRRASSGTAATPRRARTRSCASTAHATCAPTCTTRSPARADPQGGGTTVAVGPPAPDTDAVKAKVKAFVEQYNSTIDLIRSKLTGAEGQGPGDRLPGRAQGVLYNDSLLTGTVRACARRRRRAFGNPGRSTSSWRSASRPARRRGAPQRRRRWPASSCSTRPSSPPRSSRPAVREALLTATPGSRASASASRT